MAQHMGLGQLGSPDIVFKRKYRWTFSLKSPCRGQVIPPHIVKISARPNLTIEETEINFLHGKMWIPGKGTWETITVTFYDIGNDQGVQNLFSWLATVYDFTNPVTLFQSSTRGGYAGSATLTLWDGCGNAMETWGLNDVWPQAVNFGELDYSSSEEVTVELTLRYSQVSYESNCPGGGINPCCTGCGTGPGAVGKK